MRKITLTKEANCWTATFHGDDIIYGAFGTYILPTPFTAEASYETVRDSLQASNPHHMIGEAS